MPGSPHDDLLREVQLAPPHALPQLIDTCAQRLGTAGALAYLADLQQNVLVPFLGVHGAQDDEHVAVLAIDGTLAGRAFQTVAVQSQDSDTGPQRLWLPLLDGSERLGVLLVTLPSADTEPDRQVSESDLHALRRLASLTAELLVTKAMYGDTIVNVRRRTAMGLAAEIQWSQLPPLTFASEAVTVAAALEPAYQVAGDTIDYAVNTHVTHAAVFDGMGHGLRSAQLASLAVGAYRNGRRSGHTMSATAREIDRVLLECFDGETFSTAVLAELDTDHGLLRWLNAGHPEPLLLRGGRLVKSLASQTVLPLGLGEAQDDDALHVATEQLEPGDLVVLYTDGVVEARSPQGEFFGVDRLVDLIVRNLAGGLPAPETMRRAVRALLEHQQGQLTDDASLLLIEWRPENPQRYTG
jgi:serine phosphatase RsbU (regulator of sigma subunit)